VPRVQVVVASAHRKVGEQRTAHCAVQLGANVRGVVRHIQLIQSACCQWLRDASSIQVVPACIFTFLNVDAVITSTHRDTKMVVWSLVCEYQSKETTGIGGFDGSAQHIALFVHGEEWTRSFQQEARTKVALRSATSHKVLWANVAVFAHTPVIVDLPHAGTTLGSEWVIHLQKTRCVHWRIWQARLSKTRINTLTRSNLRTTLGLCIN